MPSLRNQYARGSVVLGQIGWQASPREMFKVPSFAKGSPAEIVAGQSEVSKEDVLLAARIDHLIAISGRGARIYFLANECPLNQDHIARLCRRMPPFIQAKIKDLLAGSTNIDSNPTGAFDTNGWAELRVRLPKFRSTLQHYARQCEDESFSAVMFESDAKAKLLNICAEIDDECQALLDKLRSFAPSTGGVPRKSKQPIHRTLDWDSALTKLSQVIGVLKKTNRDLNSVHWIWTPSHADLEIVRADVRAMQAAIRKILSAFGR